MGQAQADFYGSFDLEPFGGPRKAGADDDARSPFQVDRDRVLFSYAFRRLQSKTQVFQSGEYDFYRTRLTHTLEVARIARAIAEVLLSRVGGTPRPDPDLVEAVGYAHDLGHPPFGHIGERKLNELMATYGGFEGNAQTLRILTDLIFESGGRPRGMAPTRAFLDGVLKYKALHRECVAADPHSAPPDNHFLYDEQEAQRRWAFEGVDPADLPDMPGAWNALKSVECQIMDWADDTAYSLHDIVDGARAGFLTVERIEAWLERVGEDPKAEVFETCAKDLLRALREEKLESRVARRVGRYIHGCRLVEAPGALARHSARYAWRLEIDPEVKEESRFQKRLALDLIFRSPAIQQVEFRGGQALGRLFEALHTHYSDPPPAPRPLDILPEPHGSRVRAIQGNDTVQASARARLVCDYLSGLTDGQAIRLHERLYSPGAASLGPLG